MDKKLSKLLLVLLSGATLAACGAKKENSDLNQDIDEEVVEDVETEEEASEITVTMNIFVDEESVADLSKEITATEGDYVLDLLKEEYEVDETDGFVQAIEGYEQDEEEGLYWMFYVNDEMAEVGSAEYEVEDADQIDWKLESFE